MSEPPFLLTHSPGSPNLPQIRACAKAYARAGQIPEAIRTLRKSLSREVGVNDTPHIEAFDDLLANIYDSNQRAVATIEEELRELTNYALHAHPTQDEDLIETQTEALIVDLARLLEQVFDLGGVQQLTNTMQVYGIEEDTLTWIESRFSNPEPSEEADGP